MQPKVEVSGKRAGCLEHVKPKEGLRAGSDKIP